MYVNLEVVPPQMRGVSLIKVYETGWAYDHYSSERVWYRIKEHNSGYMCGVTNFVTIE